MLFFSYITHKTCLCTRAALSQPDRVRENDFQPTIKRLGTDTGQLEDKKKKANSAGDKQRVDLCVVLTFTSP